MSSHLFRSSRLPSGNPEPASPHHMVSLSQTHTSTPSDKSNLQIIKVLSSSRFPVILVEDNASSHILVLKLFPLSQGNLAKAFLHEASVLNLVHPNLIRMHHAFPRYSLQANNSLLSAVTMEHASNGDLCRLLKTAPHHLSEEAVRTLFSKLIDGLEYLHDKGLAHLDLKPENLFLEEDFNLKIGDFDQATAIRNGCTQSKGTPNYRAPEVQEENCSNLAAADVFSAGVVLFTMKSRVPPYMERRHVNGPNLYEELIKQDNSRFWEIHCKAQKNEEFFSESFKDLFAKMLDPVPENRLSIAEIKKSKWYNGSILGREGLKEELSRL